MRRDRRVKNMIQTAPETLALRIRAHLQQIAGRAIPITYPALAEALELTPPNTIHQVTEALEHLMGEDVANSHPFIATLVISRVRDGLPAPGFFYRARQLGRFDGDPSGTEAGAFYEAEFAAAVRFWNAAKATGTNGG